MNKVSVIIPNTNSPLIGRIIQALKSQNVDASVFEVLVVGTDQPGLVTVDDQVRLIPTREGVHASDKRNLGMKEASGEIFAFIDDDCVPYPDWLELHLARHAQGELVVGGSITFGRSNYLQLADNVSAFHDLLPFTPPGERTYLCTSNLSVNRRVVQHVGEMMAQKSRAEDLEWTVRFRRRGYRLYFEPQAKIFHDPRRCDLMSVWRHWTDDAPHTLAVRLRYASWLHTPALAKHRWIYLWGALAVSAWATARSFTHPQTIWKYWHTLPMVYLTKIAWCWGAYSYHPSTTSLSGSSGPGLFSERYKGNL